MKPRFWILISIACVALWPLAACSSQEPATPDQTIQQPAEQPPTATDQAAAPPSATAPAAAQIVTGELRSVDAQAKSLTVRDAAGSEQTFSFTDSTEIVGAAGAQGISAQQGNPLTVHYIEQEGRKMAVRIEVMPR
jgi:hypothetical protein